MQHRHQDLSRYRLKRAQEDLETAKLNYENGMYKAAVNRTYYAIFHAHGGDFIGLITSVDGVHWEKAKHYEVCKKQIPLKDGSIMKVDNMERPFVYVENGKPVMLSFAVKKGADSFIVMFTK